MLTFLNQLNNFPLNQLIIQFLQPHPCLQQLIKPPKVYGIQSMNLLVECIELIKVHNPFIEQDWKKVIKDFTLFLYS